MADPISVPAAEYERLKQAEKQLANILQGHEGVPEHIFATYTNEDGQTSSVFDGVPSVIAKALLMFAQRDLKAKRIIIAVAAALCDDEEAPEE